jgi:hypothetical protein
MSIRATIEAVLKTVGFDRFGREVDSVSAKMKKLGGDVRSWALTPQEQQKFGRQFYIGEEMKRSEERLRALGKAYRQAMSEQSKYPSDIHKAYLEQLTRLGGEELAIRDRLQQEAEGGDAGAGGGGAGAGGRRAGRGFGLFNMRRGFRLGLGVLDRKSVV